MTATLVNIAQKVSCHDTEFVSIHNHINLFKQLIQELIDKYAEIDKLKPLDGYVSSIAKSQQDLLASVTTRLESLKAAITATVKSHADAQSAHSALVKQLDDHKQVHADFKAKAEQKIKALEESLEAAKNTLKQDFEAKLQALKDALHVTPASILKDNKELSNKMDATKLDAEKAVVFSQRMDIGVRVLQKKVESFEIFIKRIQDQYPTQDLACRKLAN